jgi:hypothetical protein
MVVATELLQGEADVVVALETRQKVARIEVERLALAAALVKTQARCTWQKWQTLMQ